VKLSIAVLVLVAALLAGCASTLSGVGGSESFGCAAPQGSSCISVSGIYANSMASQYRPVAVASADSLFQRPAPYAARPMEATALPEAALPVLRSQPRLLRVWIAPWEDGDGDLHEEAYVHMVVNSGRWLIEHVRPLPQNRFDGVIPPRIEPGTANPSRSEQPRPEIDRLPAMPGLAPSRPETPEER
jgi:conjugal transfer pilus assembly protein TraV